MGSTRNFRSHILERRYMLTQWMLSTHNSDKNSVEDKKHTKRKPTGRVGSLCRAWRSEPRSNPPRSSKCSPSPRGPLGRFWMIDLSSRPPTLKSPIEIFTPFDAFFFFGAGARFEAAPSVGNASSSTFWSSWGVYASNNAVKPKVRSIPEV